MEKAPEAGKPSGFESTEFKEKNEKRNEAMKSVIGAFTEKLNEPVEYHFNKGGNVYPLTCEEDCLLADSQRMKMAAEAVLEDVRDEGDYYKEQAAARLTTMLVAHESLSARFAEIHQSYPEAAEVLLKQLPALASLEHTGEEVWNEVKGIV